MVSIIELDQEFPNSMSGRKNSWKIMILKKKFVSFI